METEHPKLGVISYECYKIVEIGDFIISLRSFQGGIEYSKYKGICSPAYIILRKKININEYFFKHFFKTDMFIKKLNKNLERIPDGKMVSFKQFSEIGFSSYQQVLDIGIICVDYTNLCILHKFL